MLSIFHLEVDRSPVLQQHPADGGMLVHNGPVKWGAVPPIPSPHRRTCMCYEELHCMRVANTGLQCLDA